jgi:hypothetical protein
LGVAIIAMKEETAKGQVKGQDNARTDFKLISNYSHGILPRIVSCEQATLQGHHLSSCGMETTCYYTTKPLHTAVVALEQLVVTTPHPYSLLLWRWNNLLLKDDTPTICSVLVLE